MVRVRRRNHSGSPFAVVLVGQPTLRHRLRLGVLAALDQRIAVRYTLPGMGQRRCQMVLESKDTIGQPATFPGLLPTSSGSDNRRQCPIRNMLTVDRDSDLQALMKLRTTAVG